MCVLYDNLEQLSMSCTNLMCPFQPSNQAFLLCVHSFGHSRFHACTFQLSAGYDHVDYWADFLLTDSTHALNLPISAVYCNLLHLPASELLFNLPCILPNSINHWCDYNPRVQAQIIPGYLSHEESCVSVCPSEHGRGFCFTCMQLLLATGARNVFLPMNKMRLSCTFLYLVSHSCNPTWRS